MLEIKEQQKQLESGLRTIELCQYKDKKEKCEKPATVWITTQWGRKKYCGYHFSLILFRG